MKNIFAQGGSGSAGIKTNKQAIAWAYNIKTSEVIYSTDHTAPLDGKKALYDKPNQLVWGIPTGIPSGATIVSVTGSTLVYNPGNVSVTLIPMYGSQADTLAKVDDKYSGLLTHRFAVASPSDTGFYNGELSCNDWGASLIIG